MDLEQTVAIPLKEYLELKECADHKKHVLIEECVHHFKDGKEIYVTSAGSNTWASDGAVWSRLMSRLSSAGTRTENILNGSKELMSKLRTMSWFEFRKFQKQLREDENDLHRVKRVIKGW